MSTNADLIRTLYAAYSRGDIKTILDNISADADWTSHGDANILPWAGTRHGAAGVPSAFQALAETLDFEVFEPREFHEAGDHVTVLGRSRARVKREGGGVFDIEWAHIFTLADGKVTRYREFYDTHAVARAFGA